VYSNRNKYIENGEFTLVETAPWSVGIYRLNKTNLNYHLSCGGSIIAPNVVISGKIVVHCIYEGMEIT